MKTLTVGLTIPFFASRALAVEHKYACPGAKSHCEVTFGLCVLQL